MSKYTETTARIRALEKKLRDARTAWGDPDKELDQETVQELHEELERLTDLAADWRDHA